MTVPDSKRAAEAAYQNAAPGKLPGAAVYLHEKNNRHLKVPVVNSFRSNHLIAVQRSVIGCLALTMMFLIRPLPMSDRVVMLISQV